MAPRQLQPLCIRARAAVAHPAFWFAWAYALLWYASAPLSDHPDTLRDLLQARDCAESGRCLAGGAQASVGGLRSGAAWPSTLAVLRWWGLPTEAVQILVLAADSAAVALLAVLQGAWPAGLLTAGLLWATREQLVWSPALTPLVAALAIAAWQQARQTGALHWWALLGACLGAQVDLHPVGALYCAAALLVVPWSTVQPLRAASASSSAAVLWAVALAPEVQLANLRTLQLHNVPLLPLGIGGLLVSPMAAEVCARRRRTHNMSAEPQAASLVPPFVAACLAAGAVIAGAAMGLGAVHPRYFLGALPGLSLALGPLPRLATPLAPPLILALAWALGPAEVGVGHPWPVVRHLAQVLQPHGQGWPHHLYRVQGPGCRQLSAAVEVELPEGLSPTASSGELAWQLVDLDEHTPPPGLDWQPAARWRNGRRHLTTWLRTARPWLRAQTGQACLVTQNGRECQSLRPGTVSIGASPAPSGLLPWHLRTFPAAVRLMPAAGLSQTTFSLLLTVSGPGSRRIAVQQLPDRRCPWHVDAVHSASPSLRWTRSADAQAVDLGAVAATSGSLVLSRSWGPGCDDLSEWESGPPCLLETELSP